MAHRRVEVGEQVRICHSIHKGKLGKVVGHERRSRDKWNSKHRRYFPDSPLLTYKVDIEGVGVRRMPGSYLDLV